MNRREFGRLMTLSLGLACTGQADPLKIARDDGVYVANCCDDQPSQPPEPSQPSEPQLRADCSELVMSVDPTKARPRSLQEISFQLDYELSSLKSGWTILPTWLLRVPDDWKFRAAKAELGNKRWHPKPDLGDENGGISIDYRLLEQLKKISDIGDHQWVFFATSRIPVSEIGNSRGSFKFNAQFDVGTKTGKFFPAAVILLLAQGFSHFHPLYQGEAWKALTVG